jgi:ribosomal protein S18 acetylase RimI-like enzyme
MVIRTFAPTDYASAHALWLASDGVGMSPGDEEPQVAAFLARNPGLSLVAFDGERLVGVVLCGHDGRRGYLYHLAVAPSHRRRGLARQLVERCLSGLRAAGIQRAQVSVFDTNGLAKSFWSTVGGSLRGDLAVFSIPLGGSASGC